MNGSIYLKFPVSAHYEKLKPKNIINKYNIISESFIKAKIWRQKRNLYKDRETINYKACEKEKEK